ncbi:MAG: tail fiber domain-containing protein [Bacteroidota bacterium]
MKKLFIVVFVLTTGLQAQVPQGINYQAVLRNASGSILQNQSATIKFTIHKSTSMGAIVYEETQGPVQTNNFGLVNLQIGQGTSTGVGGSFSSIPWGANNCFLQVQANIGTGYVDLGTTQFISVPYAIVADTVLHVPSGSNGWSLSGNSGTVDGVNSIGTIDSVALNFRVNGQKAGRIDPAGSTFFGYKAGLNNQSNGGNSGFGFKTLYNNITGYSGTAIGYNALYSNTTGYANTAIGDGALYSNTSGYINTAIGRNALKYNTIGRNNIAIGNAALINNLVAGQNIAIGGSALNQQSFNNGSTAYTSDNIAIGYQALFSNQPTSTSEGYQSVAVGNYSLKSNTTGFRNTAIGHNSLYSNTTGAANTAIGLNMQSNTTGSENTAIGMWALDANTTGSDNIGIGYQADVNSGNLTEATAIGFLSVTNANDKIVLGYSGNTNLTGGYGNWQNLSDGRFKQNINENVPGLSFITKLRPVTYNLNSLKFDEFLGIKQRMDTCKDVEKKDRYFKRMNEISSMTQTGFIAQEVENAANEIGYKFDGVHHPVNEKDNYTVGYATFVVPLVKGMQEQQVMIDELKKQVADLQEQLNKIQARNK